jgi:hypothetical protein
VVAGAGIAIGALVGAVLVSAGTRRVRRGKKRDAAIATGLRRGAMAGSILGLIALLRVLDGLTALTAVFVIAPFVVAEVVLSTRRT